MKKLMMFALLVSAPAFAKGGRVAAECYDKAEKAVEKFAEPGYYDADGIQGLGCELAPNQKAMICEVGAFKGDGAASDTFRVVLSLSCKKVYRVELTGEE